MLRDLVGILGPIGRFKRQTLLDQRDDFRLRPAGLQPGEGGVRLAAQRLTANALGVAAGIHGLAGEQFAPERRQAEDIRGRADAVDLAPGLLRRHVGRRAQNAAGLGPAAVAVGVDGRRRGGFVGVEECRAAGGLVQHFRQAPVHELDFAERTHHDVRRLDVAVDDAMGVGEAERLGDALDDRQGVEPGLGLDEFVERLPFDELHREERPTVGERGDPVNRRDAGMLQLPGDLGFLDEANRRGGADGIAILQNLDRDFAIHLDIPGAIHIAHAATADEFTEDVAGNNGQRAGRGWHLRRWSHSERERGIAERQRLRHGQTFTGQQARICHDLTGN